MAPVWRLSLFILEFLALRAQVALSRGLPTEHLLLQNAHIEHNSSPTTHDDQKMQSDLSDVLDAVSAMQETYFDPFAGTWPNAIDWTAAVINTHVSATLSSVVSGLDQSAITTCAEALSWSNIINKYHLQTSFFYFGENSFGLRNQAYDDMLWVVLGWLESIKFADMYTAKHWGFDEMAGSDWHGMQLKPMAAHRARIFYELASAGWDSSLCGGGMIWNSNLEPYKNAITNELYTAASISMYLYFPGDNNSAPFVAGHEYPPFGYPHDPIYLENAVKSYKWLKESQMRNQWGLYQDGFHITDWQKFRNGTVNPGTGKCDKLNTMVYTYNQGVLLTASRGLWLATGAKSYLDDGHELISSVIRATGWPNAGDEWQGLGRNGVLEEYCDHGLYCSQDGQTFKGIFFHHMAEFCRPLRPQEHDMIARVATADFSKRDYRYHLSLCEAYQRWIEHNANAAMDTKNNDGLFGMWWGIRGSEKYDGLEQHLPSGAVDYLNPVDLKQKDLNALDINDRGRGRTVETQGSALAVMRARWQWSSAYK